MARWFKGGIHPQGKKESTRKKSLVVPDMSPKRIIIPLRTPCGVELIPTVVPNQRIKWGQQVAMPDDVAPPESSFTELMEQEGVPVFSGISGKVLRVGSEPHPLFGRTTSIVIENDFKNTQETHTAYENPEQLSQEEVITLLRKRGLRGMARDTRPVHQKVMECRGKIDVLIVNASECEPYLTSDHRLLLERQELTIAGSKLLAYAMGAKEIVMALQGDKLDAIEGLEQAKGWDSSFMRVRTLPTRYPFGEEKQVIAFVTGTELLPDQPCHAAHCGVFNIATVCAVGEAIVKGMPQTHRAITITGGAVQRPRNFWLPIGSTFECIIDNAEGFRMPPALLLLGGPMSGTPLRDVSAPILVNSSGLLALTAKEVPRRLYKKEKAVRHSPCIRCGHCMAVCPQHLRPNLIFQAMNHPKKPNLSRLHPESCISCGSCNYRCPAHLPLAQTIQMAQDFIKTSQSGGFDSDIKIYDPSTDRLRIPTMSPRPKSGKKPARLVKRPEPQPTPAPPVKRKEKFRFPRKHLASEQMEETPDLFQEALTQKLGKLNVPQKDPLPTQKKPEERPDDSQEVASQRHNSPAPPEEETAVDREEASPVASDFDEDFHHDIHDDLEQDSQDSLEEDFQDSLDEDFQDSLDDDFQDSLDDDFQDNLEDDFQDSLEDDFQDNLEDDFQDSLEDEFQDSLEDNLEEPESYEEESVAIVLDETLEDLSKQPEDPTQISQEEHRILVEMVFDATPYPVVELSMEEPVPVPKTVPTPLPFLTQVPKPIDRSSVFEEVPLEELEEPVQEQLLSHDVPFVPLTPLPSFSQADTISPLAPPTSPPSKGATDSVPPTGGDL